jgi:hypothetical protein
MGELKMITAKAPRSQEAKNGKSPVLFFLGALGVLAVNLLLLH